VRVLISALRENAMRLAGELTDGAITWVTPFPYIRDTAIPALEAGAQKAGRQRPPLIAHVPVVVSTDADAVRQAAQQQIGFYPRLPYYSQMMVDAGFPEAAEGKLSDALIDELVIHGDEAQVADRIRSLPQYQADEIIAAPLVLADDRDAVPRTVTLLGALARES
jgi:alkanesulfonate monooxygenase SsuD/methylene tetrahydromethanopterin reductase-like flavin-dependent oxidoreductase (luciferase family)